LPSYIEVVTGPEAERLILSVHRWLTERAEAEGLTIEQFMAKYHEQPETKPWIAANAAASRRNGEANGLCRVEAFGFGLYLDEKLTFYPNYQVALVKPGRADDFEVQHVLDPNPETGSQPNWDSHRGGQRQGAPRAGNEG
jgi:hypothetical protein